MQGTSQIGGTLGPLRDPATGVTVQGKVWGSFSYVVHQGDPQQVVPHVHGLLLNAITQVVQQKLTTNQVAVVTIAGSLPYYTQEIIQACGAQGAGCQITQLQLSAEVAAPAPVPMMSGPMPPTPMQAMQSSLTQAAQDNLDPRNYEYEAQVNIGGFKLKGSTDKGFDTEGLKGQVKSKIKTELVWAGIGCGVLLLVGIGALILVLYIGREVAMTSGGPVAGGAKEAVSWDGATPYSCSGNQKVKIENTTATLSSGDAITASANCQLELVNVQITAPNGIKALSNAQVTVKGGTITATDTAASALGNAKIVFEGTKVTGKTQALGSATITGL